MKLLYSIVGLFMFNGIGLAAEGAQAEAQVCCTPTNGCGQNIWGQLSCDVGYPLGP